MSVSLSYRPLGNTGISVPPVCFGTSALGDMPDTYGYSVDLDRAVATVNAIIESETPFLDCSRNYGMGRSEQRIGETLKQIGSVPEQLIISTKIDRDMDTLVLDAEQTRRSFEQSLAALGVDRVQILHLHDPEYAKSLHDVTKTGGAIDELFKIKEEGLAQAVGLAAGRIDIMMPILQERQFDVLISHNRKTLVNNNADPMIELAQRKGTCVFNAAPYAGGAFAKGAANVKQYVYQPADDQTLAPVRAVEAVCARYDVAPGAAALQYSMRHPHILSTICGVSKPERIEQTLDWARAPIPDALWDELESIPRTDEDPEATRVYTPG